MSEVSERALRVKSFLEDDAVQDALKWMKDAAYTEFLAAKTAEDRQAAQSRALVIGTFEQAMRAIVDSGERERLEQEHADRRPPTR